jgi:hypothetical protein
MLEVAGCRYVVKLAGYLNITIGHYKGITLLFTRHMGHRGPGTNLITSVRRGTDPMCLDLHCDKPLRTSNGGGGITITFILEIF